MPFYFYTPIYEGPLGPPESDPEPGSGKSPGVNGDSGVEWVQPPSGLAVLKRDEVEGRFVLRLGTRSALSGWDEKSSAEVLTDYPGLQGVS